MESRFIIRYVLMRIALCATMVVVGLDSPAAGEKYRKPRPLAPLPADVPVPKNNPLSPEKVALGRQLFFDPRLSGDNKLSCATCHAPEKAWADGLARSPGKDGKLLARNTPTVLNVAYFNNLFWDGRAASLEAQALEPITSPDEMHQDLDALERELALVPGYVAQFDDVFQSRITRDGIAKALAAFQRTLVTGPSRLDRYLAGEQDALSAAAKRGLALFVGDAGCVRCHRGPLLSDEEFYRLGVSYTDRGLGAVTGQQADDYKFRTPALRNIAETGPYMHDGSLATLSDVVTFYYRDAPTRGPDGMSLDIEPLVGQSFSEIPDLVAFLESLSGKPPAIKPPELPR